MGRRNHDEMSRDRRGNYKFTLGKKKTPNGYDKQTFYLGTDRTEAEIRKLQLQKMWDVIETRFSKGVTEEDSDRPIWSAALLEIAKAVARGDSEVVVADPFRGELDADGAVLWLDEVRQDFRFLGLTIKLDDAETETTGRAYWDQTGRRFVAHGKKLLRQLGSQQRLYDALEAYKGYCDERYGLSQHGKKEKDYTGYLQASLSACSMDIVLDELDNEAIERWQRHWESRPVTKKGTPAKRGYIIRAVKTMRRFLKWLHKAKEWEWRKPHDYEITTVSVKLTNSELAAMTSTQQVETFLDDELALVWKYATPQVRVYMLLALNCGFGQAEIGSLCVDEISFDSKHRASMFSRYRDLFGSWIYRLRRKSIVYGEWKLWDITVKGLRWYMERRPQVVGSVELFLDKNGRPVVKETASGNRSSAIANLWDRLERDIQKDHPSFEMKSFNKLRKTSSDAIRDVADGEVSSVFACHGKPVASDNLIELYTNRPYWKTFPASDEYGRKIESLFSLVEDPFPSETPTRKRNTVLSVEKIEKIRRLRSEGKSYKDVAEATGVSFDTIRRYTAH